MLSQEIAKLEAENRILKDALEELREKMQQDSVPKPKSCRYCRNYQQHYIRDLTGGSARYAPLYCGHCMSGVPIGKGRKRDPSPDDTCPYFEMGTSAMWKP